MVVEKEKKPILTSRQVGLAAAFGGAGFAFRALGVCIPMVPPLVIGPGALMPSLATMAGGPLVGIIVGILRTIPSGLPLADFFGMCVVKVGYWMIVWPRILRPIKSDWIRYPLLWIFTFIHTLLLDGPYYTAFNAFVLGIYPFYPTWPFVLGWYLILFSVWSCVIFTAIIKVMPGTFGIQKK